MEICKLTPEEHERINSWLAERYGKFDNGWPYFRLIWSEDLFEIRKMTHTDEGFELVHPAIRRVPKYKGWIKDRYILEGLKAIPIYQETDLVEQVSYEPVWTFEDKHGEFLPPKQAALFYILETLKANTENPGSGQVKYRDPEATPEEALQAKHDRVEKYVAELFGNESPVGDALAVKDGVSYAGIDMPVRES